MNDYNTELQQVKTFYEQKRIIWVKGEEGSRPAQILQEMLHRISVPIPGVVWITPDQFVDMIQRGTLQTCTYFFQAFVIDGFDFLNQQARGDFLESLRQYSEFKSSYEVRVFLISSPYFCESKRFEAVLKPVIIRIPGVGDDPSDLNERIHSILEEAARIALKRVTRLSPEVAFWLEAQKWSGQDEELLVILIFALLQMGEGTVLEAQHVQAVIDKAKQKRANIGSEIAI